MTSSQDFDLVHKLVLDGISNKLSSLYNFGKYGAINTADPKQMGYDVIMYPYETYTLQEDQTTYGKVSQSGELVVKYEYLSLMEENTNWYWQHHGTNQSVIISNHTIAHPCLDMSVIKNFVAIPKIV